MRMEAVNYLGLKPEASETLARVIEQCLLLLGYPVFLLALSYVLFYTLRRDSANSLIEVPGAPEFVTPQLVTE